MTVAAYDPNSRPHPAVAVDVILFTIEGGKLRVLLICRDLPPYLNEWALPGGFVRIDESLDEAARRELLEEAGLEVRWLEQLYTFGDVDRDPARRVISVAYFALIDASQLTPRAGGDARGVRWRDVRRLPKLAFDHRRIIRYAHERLRYKTEYAPVAFQLLPDAFTLTDLQRVYEVIHGRDLDKRNFRRKVNSLEVLEPTGERRKEGRGRPAALYRFRKDSFRSLGGGVVMSF
ncbi:MAG TPA: NUDIX hydrolase [Polyangiaceae bacterium]|nr:NUDIX hydrolase [Polyangiaceae bacterium]